MATHRARPAAQFVIIPNDTLRDSRLSYLARGILAEHLSHSDDWRTTADDIAQRARAERGKTGEGRRPVAGALAELVAAGYLYREQRRGPGGRIVTELHWFDEAQPLDDDGTPIGFRLRDRLTDMPDGGVSARPAKTPNGAARTGVPGGGTSVRPAQTQVAACGTDKPVTDSRSTGMPVTDLPVTGVPIRRPSTNTDTKIISPKSNSDEDPGVLWSVAEVEGSGDAPGQDHDFAADRAFLGKLSGERQSELLDLALSRLGADCSTREMIREAAELAKAVPPLQTADQ